MTKLFSILCACLVMASVGPLRAADEPFDLYAVLPMTGAAAFLGRGEAQSSLAFEKYVNAHGGIRGRPLHIVVEDDQTNPQVALQLINQLIAKNVAVFIGPAFGPPCAAAVPLVANNGPVMFCLSPSIVAPPGSHVFTVVLTNRDQYANAMRYLKAKGIRTLAFLGSTDASGQDQENGALEALKYPDLRDMKVLVDEHMAPTDVSVAAQLARVKASGAQALLAFVTGTPFATVLRAANDSGYDGLVLTGAGNAVKDQIASYSGFLPNTLLFGTLPFQMDEGISPRVRAERAVFFDALKQVTTEQPGVPQSVPWDPLTIIVDGYRKLGTRATASQMRDYILSVRNFAGIMGTYDFRAKDQRGLDPRASGAMRWDKGTQGFVVVSRPAGVPL